MDTSNAYAKKLYVALFASSLTTHAWATEPASVPVGNLALTPTVDLTTGYTDNLFDSVSDEKSTWFSTVRPGLNLQGSKGGLTAGVNASLEHGVYYSSRADDYTDKGVSAYATVEFDSRKKLDLLAEYLKLHDARSDSGSGDALSTDVASKASRYTMKNLGATFTYGTPRSTGQIIVKGDISDKEYDNFRDFTASKDRQTKSVSGTFFYRVAPKTRMLVEGRYKDVDYDLSSVTLDSDTKKLLVGVEWDATAKTSGLAKIGYARKDFDNNARDDFSGSSWEVGVTWAPRTYSMFDLSTSREAEESSGAADYIDTTSWTLGWSHEWTDVVASRVSYNSLNEDYVGDPSGTDDDTGTFTVGLSYDMRRWLTLGVDVSHVSFDSNQPDADYDSNTIVFKVQGSL